MGIPTAFKVGRMLEATYTIAAFYCVRLRHRTHLLTKYEEVGV